MIFLDTESIGFFGPTVLIQYCVGEPIRLHNIFDTTVEETLDLIEKIVEHPGGVVGYNLVHDWFHLTKTYNVLKCLPFRAKINPLDYADVEATDEAHDKYCLKPVTALDLLLHGKKNEFQSILNQKDIHLRKVPKVLAQQLVDDLTNTIKIPDIYFSKSKIGYHWIVSDVEKDDGSIDGNFVNLKLQFNPSAALKAVMRSLGHEVTEMEDLNEMDRLPNLKHVDCGWFPCNSKWLSVFREYIFAWRNNTKRLKYAENDVKYLRILYDHFNRPAFGDSDSLLACAVGGMYWHGFSIDKEACRLRYKKLKSFIDVCPINVSSPVEVKKYLQQIASPLEQKAIKDTSKDTLQYIIDNWKDSNPELYNRCKTVQDTRRYKIEIMLIERILTAGRLYAVTKVIGTKSNRQAGGSENYIKSNGTINVQGIKKGNETRSLFTLADFADMQLDGGDFDSFEVSIADAIYNDSNLRKDLQSGKKIHGLFGAEMYNEAYETIMLTKDDFHGKYGKAKSGFFGTLYGAQKQKLAQTLGISEQEAQQGLERLFQKYPGIKEAQQKITNSLACLTQPDGIGTKVVWKEPKQYVESFFGFRRSFVLEFSIIRALFDMANNPSENLVRLGKSIRVVRRDRVQTGSGAAVSALYAAAFNLNGAIIRAAINHDIQSPGGEATKKVQAEIWTVQPTGINPWFVLPINIHDEIECVTHKSVSAIVKSRVDSLVLKLTQYIPLIKMEWKTNMKNWGEK